MDSPRVWNPPPLQCGGGIDSPVKAGVRTLAASLCCQTGRLWMEVVVADNYTNIRENEFTQNY
jgi:hypothetical protein